MTSNRISPLSITNNIIPAERIQGRIIVLRGQRVLLDADLAELYEVPTKRLNEQVKRNVDKFPEDFMFRLTKEEAEQVLRSRSQNATSRRGQNVKYLPYAFTEHGAIQAANVLSSPAATEMSVQVVRAFVGLRQLMVNHKALSSKLAELDARVGAHDEQLVAIIEAIRQLAEPVPTAANSRKIGFVRRAARRAPARRTPALRFGAAPFGGDHLRASALRHPGNR